MHKFFSSARWNTLFSSALIALAACSASPPSSPPPGDAGAGPILLVGTLPQSPSNQLSPALQGRGSPNAAVGLFANEACTGTALASATTDADGHFVAAVRVGADRTTPLGARYLGASTPGCASNVITYVNDATPPEPPTLEGTRPASPSNETNPSVEGLAERGSTVRLFSSGDCSGAPLAEGVVPNSGAFSLSIHVARNSTTRVRATATDAAGNNSGCVLAGVVYENDSQAPPGPELRGTTPVSPSSVFNPTIDGWAEPFSIVRIYASDTCQGGTVGTAVSAANGEFHAPVAVLQDTTTPFSARALDDRGNTSDCSTQRLQYVQDSTAPVTPVFTGTVPGSPTTATSGVVHGTAEPDSSVRLYTTPDCSGLPVAKVIADAQGNFTTPVRVMENSSITLYGTSIDAAGNVSACTPVGITFTNDLLPPAAPTVSAASPQSPSRERTPVVSGSAEAGSTVRLYGRSGCMGEVLATTAATASGTFTTAAAALPNTTTTFTATATDLAGNVSLCSPVGLLYVHDDLAPAVPTWNGTTPASPSQSLAFALDASAEARSSVRLFTTAGCSGTPVAAATTDASGTVRFDLTAPANRATTYFANATDAAGNVSPCTPEGLTYVHDGLAPDAPTFTSTVPPSPSRLGTSVEILGRAEAGATVQLYRDASCSSAAPLGATADGGGVFHFFTVVNANSVTLFTAAATDAAGNRSACSATLSYLHDDLAPAPPVWVGTSPASPSTELNPTLLGTAEAASTVRIFVGAGCTGAPTASTTASAAGQFNAAVTVAQDALTTFSAVAIDAVGNTSGCTPTTVPFRNDTTAPGTPRLTATVPASPATDTTPDLVGTAEAGATVDLFTNAECSGTPLATTLADGAGNLAFNVTVARNTTTTFYAQARDALSNRSPCSRPGLVYVQDDVVPGAPVLVGTTPTSPSASVTSPLVSGTAEPRSHVRLFLSPTCAGAVAATVDASALGQFSAAVTVPADTISVLSARTRDDAGNESPCSNALTYQHDSGPPGAPVWTGATPPSPSRATAPLLSGQSEAGATVRIYAGSACAATPLVTTLADELGRFGATVNVSADTTATFTANATDTTGNLSPCSAPLPYQNDSAPPAVPLLTATTPASPSSVLRPTLLGSAEAQSLVRIYTQAACAGSVVATTSAGPTGAFSTPVDAAANATTTFYATASDASGNTSPCTPTGLPYTNDSVVPAMPVVSATVPVSPNASVSSPTVQGTAEAGTTVRLYGTTACTGTALATTTATAGGTYSVVVPLTANTSTTLRATAGDGAGNTSACSTTSVTYVNDSLPPSFGGPTGAVADSASQLRVFWNPATDNVTPQSQLVYDVCWNTLRRADGGCNPFVAMATTAAGAVVHALPGLLAQTRYYMQVRARDGVGNTDANNVEVSAQTAGTRVLSRIYARANHACVLTGNGEVRCWGQNTSGQLGDGTTNTSTVPLLVAGLRDVVQLGLGTDHSCALLANGTVKCWGTNLDGRLGDPTLSQSATPITVPGLAGVAQLSSGYSHTCALLHDATLRCWGSNGDGRLGLGSTTVTSTSVPTAVSGLSGAIGLSASARHTCALLADNTLRCWGYNGFGQLGDSTVTARSAPTPVALAGTNLVSVTTGVYHSCALAADGSVRCWGANFQGQLGDSSAVQRNAPVSTSPVQTAFTSLMAGNLHSCGTRSDGAMYCWGDALVGQLANGTTSDRYFPGAVPNVTNVVQAASGDNFLCAVLSDGSARCWGQGDQGQLGNGALTNAFSAAALTPFSGSLGATRIASGLAHACAGLVDGTAMCWGYNSDGQLGEGTTSNASLPSVVAGVTGVTRLAAGDGHSCALRSDGTVRCWGRNTNGTLGDGTTTSRATQKLVTGLATVRELAAGAEHTCAILGDGTLRCWGRNDAGQVGDGTTAVRTTATAPSLAGATVNQVALGREHTCAVLSTRTVKCWGRGESSQLGDGTSTTRLTPTAVTGLAGVLAVSAGDAHGCALLVGGTVQCWGRGDFGQLGNGGTSSTTPTAVTGLTGALSLSSGRDHTCALVSGGAVRCWGRNDAGQLGNGTTASALTPVAAGAFTSAVAVSASGSHTTVLLADGTARTFGSNGSGELGDGTLLPKSSPTLVVSLP